VIEIEQTTGTTHFTTLQALACYLIRHYRGRRDWRSLPKFQSYTWTEEVDSSSNDNTEEFDSCLSSIYQRCKRLESLQLAWYAGQTLWCTSSQSADFSPRLRSLFLHRKDEDKDTKMPLLSAHGLITISSGPHNYLFILLTITTTGLSRSGEHHK
jgi:hypothetical protein